LVPLEPIQWEKSSSSIEAAPDKGGSLRKHENPKVNLNIVFRDGSAMPNTRRGSPGANDANLVDSSQYRYAIT